MIPVQLTIEGLYSYQERQIIDFKNLTMPGYLVFSGLWVLENHRYLKLFRLLYMVKRNV
jgi:hypothetical protein